MAITKIPAAGFTGNNFRNIIINGDMSIAQRGTSATTVSGDGVYDTLDRWKFFDNSSGAFTTEQSTSVPSGQGFSNSLLANVTTADTSIGSAEYALIIHNIEAQNLQYLNYGTSSAKDLVLSFWVKSSKTGQYSITVDKRDTTRMTFVSSYTINTANTWEKKIIEIPSDANNKASKGIINNDNGAGLIVYWNLATGSDNQSSTEDAWTDGVKFGLSSDVNWMDSTSNDFYLTGCQLEAGTSASDFEFLPYDVNLQRCLRYYYLHAEGNSKRLCTATAYNTAIIDGTVFFKNTMRTTPSLVITSGTDYYRANGNNGGDSFNDMFVLEGNTNQIGLRNTSQFSGVTGYSYFINTNNASSSMAFDSEL